MNYISRTFLITFALFVTCLSAFASEFAEGQVWKMESGFYQDTKVVIVKVEDHPAQKHVVHISVLGPITGRNGIIVSELPHFPFRTEGLNKSNIFNVGMTKELPDSWREGYELWNKEAMAGSAGAFTISVSEVIDTVFSQIPRAETQIIDPNTVAINEYVHEKLSDSLLKRIKVTTDVFEPIDDMSFEEVVDLYKRDFHPEDNIAIWEEMARVFTMFCEVNCQNMDKKKEVYKALLITSMFPKDQVYQYLQPQLLSKKEVQSLTTMYILPSKSIGVYSK